jgi:hypothetical protein
VTESHPRAAKVQTNRPLPDRISIRLPVSYAHHYAVVVEHSQKLDRPSQWPLNHRGAIVRLHSPLTESLPGSLC